MSEKALVIIDIQNDITKNYKEIIANINTAIDWAVACDMHVVYIRHNNLSAGTRTFKPGTKGAELVPEMKIVSDNIFDKSKGNALCCSALNFSLCTTTNTSYFHNPATHEKYYPQILHHPRCDIS